MKILVTGPSYQNQTQSVARALERLGHDVQRYPMADFYMGAGYWKKKAYKLGGHFVKWRYEERIANDLRKTCKEFQPDFVFVLNGLMIAIPALDVLRGYEKALWMWDSLQRSSGWNVVLPYFRKIYTFEAQDVETLKSRSGVDASWLPLGYDDTIFYPMDAPKDIDISFIGIPTPYRLQILDQVAEYAEREHKTMTVGGPWYSTEHFWKKRAFRRKHPALMKYIQNRIFSPEEAADIYRRSNVCLNIIAERRTIRGGIIRACSKSQRQGRSKSCSVARESC